MVEGNKSMGNTVEQTVDGGIAILKVTGALDLNGMNELKDAISGARRTGALKIVIDLEEMTTLSSSLLQNIVAPVKAIFLMNGKVVVINTGKTERALKNSMLGNMVSVCSDLAAAKEHLGE